jgi:hypothetical protein
MDVVCLVIGCLIVCATFGFSIGCAVFFLMLALMTTVDPEA